MEEIVKQMQRYMKPYGCEMLFAAGAENVFYLSDMDVTACTVNPVLFAVQSLSPTVVMVPKSGRKVIFTASALKQYLDDKNTSADIFYYPSDLFLRYNDGIDKPEIYAPTLQDCIRRYLSDFSGFGSAIFADETFCRLNKKHVMLPAAPNDAEKMLAACRAIKVPEEIRRIKIASKASYAAMTRVEELLSQKGSLYEDDLFYQMRDVIYRQRCQWNYTSLSAGPYSPDIYHQPCHYHLQQGDVVRMDVGGACQGYGSDVARCFFYGQAHSEEQRLYNVLCEAQARMVEMARPGADLGELFALGDRYIRSHGYPEYKRALLGHSVGVSTEEQPFISPQNVGIVMQPNMIFSIETPYYIKDCAGFNVEDIMLITENGHEVLI